MQTAYFQLVRLFHRFSRWCHSLWARSRFGSITSPARAHPNVRDFNRAGACTQRRASALPPAVKPASEKAATPGLTLVATSSTPNPAAPFVTAAARTVRIHRVGAGASERMALVGRMSDVCAELDRLVLRERRRA